MITKQTAATIQGYLEGFIDVLLNQHRPAQRRRISREARETYQSKEGVIKPFHEAIIPPEVLRISEFERSFSTKLGTTFEECARLIAEQTFRVAKRNYSATGKMPVAAAAKIEEIVSRIATSHKPDFLALVEEVLAVKDQQWKTRPVIADIYLEAKNGNRYYFEIKSPKPNKGQCLEITERLLRIHAITQARRPQVNAYYAMAYNPYGRSKAEYTHSFSNQYLDMQQEVLLGSEFWDLIGGPGTYEELLGIYRQVGLAKTKSVIDTLLHGF